MLRAAETTCKTDTGRQRRDNEDNAYARAPVFVVADGMGGAQAGEVASRIAIEAFEGGLPDAGSPEERLRTLVREANHEIYERARADRQRAGMGTTLTAAYVDNAHVAIAHVGDSRAYLFRDGTLQRLTQDHSLVDELVRRGKLTEEQAAEHPQRSIITRALGPEPDVEVDTWTYPARAGDVVLLCSDGLTSMISEERVREILAAHSNLDAAGDALINEANEAGGRDNITVVLFRLEEVADGDGTADQETMVGLAGVPGPPASGHGDSDAGGDSESAGRAGDSRGSTAVAVAPPPTLPTLRRASAESAWRDASAGPAPSGRPGSPASLHQADSCARRHGDRRRDHRQRRLPGQPPALLRRDQRAGHRHDLSGLSVRPAVRGPPVRDLLRLRRSGLADPGGPARRPAQQRPAFTDERDQPRDGSRAGKDLPVSFIGGPPTVTD